MNSLFSWKKPNFPVNLNYLALFSLIVDIIETTKTQHKNDKSDDKR